MHLLRVLQIFLTLGIKKISCFFLSLLFGFVLFLPYLQKFVVVLPLVVDGPHRERVEVAESNLEEKKANPLKKRSLFLLLREEKPAKPGHGLKYSKEPFHPAEPAEAVPAWIHL
jgi:hypothetical protein